MERKLRITITVDESNLKYVDECQKINNRSRSSMINRLITIEKYCEEKGIE